jgi:hypothetical protein
LKQKIELIKEAIAKADRLESQLIFPATEVPSFTSMKIRHLLNNLGGISNYYLECGTHKGGHFCSVGYFNVNLSMMTAIDNYSEFDNGGETKEEFYRNAKQFVYPTINWELIEEDCFQVKSLDENLYDFYNYDAQHTESSQQRAVTHFLPNLTKEFIMVVDDWTFSGVETGTRNGIKIAGLEVLFESILLTPEGTLPNDGWHNGFAVFLLKQKP